MRAAGPAPSQPRRRAAQCTRENEGQGRHLDIVLHEAVRLVPTEAGCQRLRNGADSQGHAALVAQGGNESRSQGWIRREEGGKKVRNPKVCVPKIWPKSIIPFVNFNFSHYEIWVGGRGVAPHPPMVVSRSDISLPVPKIPTGFVPDSTGCRATLEQEMKILLIYTQPQQCSTKQRSTNSAWPITNSGMPITDSCWLITAVGVGEHWLARAGGGGGGHWSPFPGPLIILKCVSWGKCFLNKILRGRFAVVGHH